MIIDFKNMEAQNMVGFKGGEKSVEAKMFADDDNRVMFGRLIPGASIGMHAHEGSSEVIFILEGCGKVLFDDSLEEVKTGDVHYCPEGHRHSLINDSKSDLTYFAVVPNHR